MADGDLLTIVAGHQAFAPAAEIVAGVQTLTLLTAHIAFDDTSGFFGTLAEGGIVKCFNLPEGAILLKSWATSTIGFDPCTGNMILFVTNATTPSLGGAAVSGGWNVQTPTENAYRVAALQRGTLQATGTYPDSNVYHLKADVALWASFDDATPEPTAGEFDAYALIAEPS